MPLDIGYAGGLTDPLTGLVRFGMRDYDPASGRFTERDPTLYEGGLSLYAYAGDDPIDHIDPTGTGGLNAFTGEPEPEVQTSAQMDQTLNNLSKAEQELAQIEAEGPKETTVQKIGKYLKGVREKAAEKLGDFVQACKTFANGGSDPTTAVPLVEEGIGEASGQGDVELTPGFMAQDALSKGASVIESAHGGMGSEGNDQMAQALNSH